MKRPSAAALIVIALDVRWKRFFPDWEQNIASAVLIGCGIEFGSCSTRHEALTAVRSQSSVC
jgi:hypothetical protein